MAKKQNKAIKEETLETILFNCRNSLRGRAAMTDKRDLLLTLVFLKFIGERFKQQKEKIRHEIVEVQGINDTDFSINAHKEEGEFYTPHSIVELIASLIEPFDGTVYDPCCGSGGMFVQAAKFIEAHGGNTKVVNVYRQESEPATYRLAKMNLAIRGISYHLGDRAVSTFSDDQHKELKFDYIMANPPFNLKKYAEYGGFETDPRWQGCQQCQLCVDSSYPKQIEQQQERRSMAWQTTSRPYR